MASKTQDEQNTLQFLTLLTEFYCGLTVRKDMQHIACEIRQFVMMRKDIKKKEQVAKNLLDYFLKIQSKLTKKTDADWDHAFQISTARGRALLRICNFPHRHILLRAFNQIKTPEHPISPSSMNILSNTTTQVSEYDHIQVQEDVRVKTQFFFRWCQYVTHSKAFKQLKMREVQNQKISLNFNKYGIKFNYFNAWKKLYKNHKTQSQRVKIIQTKHNENILKQSLMTIQQTAAIIGFESQLSSKVISKNIEFQKRLVYKKLKINCEKIKQFTKIKKCNNLVYYTFMKYLIQKGKPFMNKSFVAARKKIESDENALIITKAFKAIQNQSNKTINKIKQIIIKRKNNYLLGWNSQYKFDINNTKNEDGTKKYLNERRKKIVLTILNFNKLVKREQFTKIQNMVCNNSCYPLPNLKIIQANNKKQSQNKRIQLMIFLSSEKIRRTFNKMKTSHFSFVTKLKNQLCFKTLQFKRLINRYKSYKLKVGIKNKIHSELGQRYLNNLCYFNFRKWRKLKFYHKLEQQSLNVIEKLSRKITMFTFWNKFKFRLQEKQSMTKFANITNNAFVKIAFMKIMGRSGLINEKVKKMRELKSTQQMKKLFQLLIKNVSYNTKTSNQIQNVYAKRCECVLIKNLKTIFKEKEKRMRIQSNSSMKNIKTFLNKMRQLKLTNNDTKSKCSKISKIIFLKYFKRSVQQSRKIIQINQYKIEQAENKIRQILALKLIQRLNRNQEQKQSEATRYNKIIFKKIRASVIKINQYIQHLKTDKKINLNTNKIKTRKINQAIKFLALKQKSKKIENQINRNRLSLGFSDFRYLTIAKRNIQKCSQITKQWVLNKNFQTFLKSAQAEKQQLNIKISKIQQLNEKSQKQNIIVALNLLKINKQNIFNSKKLSDFKKNKIFSQFMAMSLSSKFSRIKFNCSLKTYAKNLLKKGFKSFKQSHLKVKQKQNMIRLDKTSSIMIQKSIQKSFKSNTLSQQIQRFNLRKSRQIR